MSNRTLLFMTVAVLAGVALLLLLNLTKLFQTVESGQYISRMEIKGATLIRNQKNYTLNYEEQTELVSYINRALLVKKDEIAQQGTPADFDKIILHRFSLPDLTIVPVKMIGNELVFTESTINPNGWFKDTTHGELKTLINKASGNEAPAGSSEAAQTFEKKEYVAPNTVVGVTLIGFDLKEQKLNLIQTKELVDYINKATPIDKQIVLEKGAKTEVDKIRILRKSEPTIEITAVAYVDNELVFYEANWNPNGLLQDHSHGALKSLLSKYL